MIRASKTFQTLSDMGNIKIFSKSMACFFANGYGDGGNIVKIYAKQCDLRKGEFIGHFTVRDGEEVKLSGYDCEDDGVYTFGPGRWFVHRSKPSVFHISLYEKDRLES